MNYQLQLSGKMVPATVGEKLQYKSSECKYVQVIGRSGFRINSGNINMAG